MNIQEIVVKEGIGDFINKGAGSRVYHIRNTDYAIKIPNLKLVNRTKAACLLEKENRIARKLHEAEVSVPKPEEVFGIRDPKTQEFVPCYTMEYIPSSKVRWYNRFRVNKKYDEEVKKAEKEDLVVGDSGQAHNMLWCPKRRKVYLIDFEYWGEN